MELPTQYQQMIHLSRYSRWDYEKGRRETWEETVNRYFEFFKNHIKGVDLEAYPIFDEARKAVLKLEVMPSMRCLMTAGPALEKENVAGYNCSYVKIDSPRSFDEILYILMNGTGVGFSVEQEYIEKLPTVPNDLYPTDTVIKVADSKLGWAKALKELVTLLYSGLIPEIDYSKVRPAGSVLKTFGGRASGPQPLINLFNFIIELFKNATGRKLKSIECHDIVCKIAEIVVVGGVRRSALISLSDLGDDSLRRAKTGRWWDDNSQRALANNSANYTGFPDIGTFMHEWVSLYESKSGERGIYSSRNAAEHVKKNLEGRREPREDFGTNPCSEIILRSREFCNLSEVVIRENDTYDDLIRKVKLATFLGTLQSTLTNFKYLSNEWKKNCEEERLLGVSLTGIMDNNLTKYPDPRMLNSLKQAAQEVNEFFANVLEIPKSAAITCVKPSGTVSQLVDSASGIHARHSPYYIRRVRLDKKDPLCRFMVDKGFPCEEDVMNNTNMVFSFPMKSPETSFTRNEQTALEQLETWWTYAKHWCEHKPSVTISVREDEWLQVGAWVYDNFDYVSGISFLPHSDHIYQQAPYEDCDEKAYEQLKTQVPTVDWKELVEYEKEDYTVASQELACTGNSCEII